jgi:SPP1 family predicted phage head-tail adaptor
MMNIGRFRQRLSLEAPVETPDGAGGVSRSWVVLSPLWGELRPVSLSDVFDHDRLNGQVSHRITVRSRIDLTTKHRLKLGTRVFRILSHRTLDAYGRFTEILAEELLS